MNISSDEAKQIAEEAYVYGFPLILMDLTRKKMSNVPQASQFVAPINQLAHASKFPTHEFTDVVRPNVDTLYSIAWLELSDGPMILHVPDTNGRYYLMEMLDAWTNVFASPGKRTTGTEDNDFVITGPFWNGKIPAGLTEIKSPTNLVWIIGRIQTNGVDDIDAVNVIQKQVTLMPLNSFGKLYVPPQNVTVDSTIDMDTSPIAKIHQGDVDTFFNHMTLLMKSNPPTPADVELVSKFKKIGLIPGQEFNSSNLLPEIIDSIKLGAKAARQKIESNLVNIGTVENGWQKSLDIGNYDTNYLLRAGIAHGGLGANLPEDAIYPFAFTDSNGDALNGANKYVIHFPEDQIPPVNAFWSITMYGKDQFLVKNPINRYAIGDRDELEFNEDGSLDIYFQHETPKEKKSNWLPSPEDDFSLVLRLYWPSQKIIDGNWEIPPIRKIE